MEEKINKNERFMLRYTKKYNGNTRRYLFIDSTSLFLLANS